MPDARNVYRERAVQGASRVGLVVLLYEQMIEDLRRALEALEHNQIELRTRCINHTILVLGHLQNTLNMDQGGKVACNLERFYNLLRAKLVEAQGRASKELLKAQIESLLSLRDAWIEVDRADRVARAGSETGASSGQPPARDWKG
jgi:flagellar protein FliS